MRLEFCHLVSFNWKSGYFSTNSCFGMSCSGASVSHKINPIIWLNFRKFEWIAGDRLLKSHLVLGVPELMMVWLETYFDSCCIHSPDRQDHRQDQTLELRDRANSARGREGSWLMSLMQDGERRVTQFLCQRER